LHLFFLILPTLETRRGRGGEEEDEEEEEEEVYLELEYSKSLPVAEKMIRAISASHRTESSAAFLKIPLLLFEKVTCLAVMLSIFLIFIFSLAIFSDFPAIFAPHPINYSHKQAKERERNILGIGQSLYTKGNQVKLLHIVGKYTIDI